MLPQYAREVLGEEHLACFFVDLRGALDFSPIRENLASAALTLSAEDMDTLNRLAEWT